MKKLSVILCTLCLLGIAWWAQARVVVVASGGTATAASSSITFKDIVEEQPASAGDMYTTDTLAITAGDLVVIGYASTDASTNEGAYIRYTGGNQYLTMIKRETAEGYTAELWHGIATTTETVPIGILCTTGPSYNILVGANYSGIAATPLDQSSCNVATCDAQSDHATDRTAQNVTTTQASELLVFFEVDWESHTTYTAAANWTKRTAAGTKNWALIDRVLTSTGTHPSGNVATVDDSLVDDGYYSILATFKGQ